VQNKKLVALSSTDAEVYAMVDCLKTALWFRNLIQELNITPLTQIHIFQDNKSAIIMVTEHSKTTRSKHILTKICYAKSLVNNGLVQVHYLSTAEMFADMLTKPQHGETFISHSGNIMGNNPNTFFED
jgi:hypothetical protein